MAQATSRQANVARLLDLWGEVELVAVELSRAMDESDKVSIRLLAHWFETFADEIELLERVRNSVVHGHQVPDEDLNDAVELAARLLRLLRAKQERATGE